MRFLEEPYAFVDLETTGTNPIFDRITEIAVIHWSSAGQRQVWHTLINPEQGIPEQIVSLTGINNDMVRDAPTFADIAVELRQLLDTTILIAHNARFDYGFLKNAFKREQISYRPKMICSVKLSRALYPKERRHNLATICQRLKIVRDQAHRAMADAQALEAVVEQFVQANGDEVLQRAVAMQWAKPSLPVHLEPQQIDSIPRSAGVYRFYGEGNSLLYVGKSINLYQRVRSHFASDHSNNQDMKLVQSVRSIEWDCTGGDLGAQLLEARQIKDLSPVLNRRQRRHNTLYCFKLVPDRAGYLVPKLIDKATEDCYWHEDFYGLFRNRSSARKTLSKVADEHGLCKKLLGIETGKGACFGLQLKKCRGACVGQESVALYNLRLEVAMQEHRVKVWPYSGPVVVREDAVDNGANYFHLINHWAYLGSFTAESAIELEAAGQQEPQFEIDSYRIILRYFRNFPDKIHVL